MISVFSREEKRTWIRKCGKAIIWMSWRTFLWCSNVRQRSSLACSNIARAIWICGRSLRSWRRSSAAKWQHRNDRREWLDGVVCDHFVCPANWCRHSVSDWNRIHLGGQWQFQMNQSLAILTLFMSHSTIAYLCNAAATCSADWPCNDRMWMRMSTQLLRLAISISQLNYLMVQYTRKIFACFCNVCGDLLIANGFFNQNTIDAIAVLGVFALFRTILVRVIIYREHICHSWLYGQTTCYIGYCVCC